jgi:4-hydroxythreonine-4-phosphate dehydrogenase
LIEIALTLGDPAGIGAETIAKSVVRYYPSDVHYTVFGNLAHFELLYSKFAWGKRFLNSIARNDLDFTDTGDCGTISIGCNSTAGGRVAYDSLHTALDFCSTHNCRALVTAPISKKALHLASHFYAGHTEILAEYFKCETTMMLFCSNFRVSLVTTHIPLADVSQNITAGNVFATVGRTNDYLGRYFGIAAPKIAVLALNPHAGESGAIGCEESTIAQAVHQARELGIDAVGPLVPDIAFTPKNRALYDGYVAMFHDQGLIPLKTLHFDKGVNVTLGLPIVRTSPDHGTAFDIAGKGVANPSSTIAALKAAIKFSRV